jgi:hypothetical protein
MRHHGDTDSGTRNYCFAMGSMIVFSVDVRRLADFYEAVLGVTRTNDGSEDIRLRSDREEFWFTHFRRESPRPSVSGHVKIPVGGQ